MPATGAPVRFSEQGRSSTRMLVAMPVTITGKTEAGHAFEEKTRTVVVNGTGCKLVCEQALSIGDQLTLVIANSKRSAVATVGWIGDRKGKVLEAGLDFNTPDPTFWGVTFPEDAPATNSGDAKPAAESKGAARAEAKCEPAVENKTETKPSKSEAKPVLAASTPAKKSTALDTPTAPTAPLAQAVKSATRPATGNAGTPASGNSIATIARPKVSQVSPPTPPVVSALTPAMNPPPNPSVPSGAAPTKLGPTSIAQGDLASSMSGETENPSIISIRRPQISISDDGLKSLGGDLLLGMVQHLVREAFQEVLTQVLEDFDRYCTTTIERAKNAALAEMQDRVRNAVTDALQPALEASVQGARSHLDIAAKQISMHHAKRLEASMQQALENTEKALEERVGDYDQRLASTSAQFCQDLARRLSQPTAA